MKLTRTPFAIVPLWVYRHPQVTPTIMQVYLALASRSYDRKAPRGVPWLVEETGLGRSSVYAALAALVAVGAMVEDFDGVFLPTDEPVRDESSSVDDPPDESSSVDDPSSTVESESSSVDSSCSSLESNDLEVLLEAAPALVLVPQGAPTAPSVEDGFDRFWKVYPARNGRTVGKAQAFAQWRKLKPTDMLDAWTGAGYYAAECEAGLTIAADAHRWLRDRRWVDYQTPPAMTAPQARNGSRSAWLDRPGKAPLAERIAASLGQSEPFALTAGDER